VGRERGVNLGNGVLLHSGHDVAVELQGNADLGMAEPLAGKGDAPALRGPTLDSLRG
jgi:hypothetical protein